MSRFLKWLSNSQAPNAPTLLNADKFMVLIHWIGGGVPIRVTGVEGVVAVVVVSGLKQDQDHGVIVEVVQGLYH